MRLFLVNIAALAFSLGLFFAFQVGVVAASDAFFSAATLMAAYTAFQLSEREGKPLVPTLHAIVVRPEAHPRVTAYAAYVGVLGLSTVLLAQSVIA